MSEKELQLIAMWLRNTLHYEMPFTKQKALQIDPTTLLVVEKNTIEDEIIGFRIRLIRENRVIPIIGHSEFDYINDENTAIDKTLNVLKSL